MDWDGAVIFDSAGDFDSNIELFEIANLQLLKSRILDDDLDERLEKALRLIGATKKRMTIIRSGEMRKVVREIIETRTQSILESEAVERTSNLSETGIGLNSIPSSLENSTSTAGRSTSRKSSILSKTFTPWPRRTLAFPTALRWNSSSWQAGLCCCSSMLRSSYSQRSSYHPHRLCALHSPFFCYYTRLQLHKKRFPFGTKIDSRRIPRIDFSGAVHILIPSLRVRSFDISPCLFGFKPPLPHDPGYLFMVDIDPFAVKLGGHPAITVCFMFFRDLFYPVNQCFIGVRLGRYVIITASRQAHEFAPPRDALEQFSVVGNELPFLLDCSKVRCKAFFKNSISKNALPSICSQLTNVFFPGGFFGCFITEPAFCILLFPVIQKT